MDKKVLLEKLEHLQVNSSSDLKTTQEVGSWGNKVAPLLQLINSNLYLRFLPCLTRLRLNLSRNTLESNFNIMHSQVEMAIEELKLHVEDENSLLEQFYFPANSHLEIQKTLSRIITQSKNTLWICDGFMDEKIVEELSKVVAPEIKLLTKNPKSLFKQRLMAAQKQFSAFKNIEAKIFDNIHDRFFIIDRDQVWHFGTSYNNAGNLPTMLNKIKSEEESQKIISDFEGWWKLAINIS